MTKRVLVTGGTGGLGRATAAALAGAGWDVLITGRGAESVRDTAARLGGRVTGMPLDLGSLASVREFARELPPLRAVICNAGIQLPTGSARTADGIEQTFGVNHLAHFLLVRELLPRLVTPARVVFVASDTHDPRRLTGMPAPAYTGARSLAFPPDENGDRPGVAGRRRYTTSKLCNVLTAYEFARRTPTSQATVNAFDPGLMPGTDLARDYAPLARFAWRYVLPALTVVPGVNIHTPSRSGAALARLVLDPALAETTGRYFSGRHETHSSRESYDLTTATDLWTGSEELAKPSPARD